MGSDVPDLPARIVGKAFRFLTVVDSVIGPSFDGGYYLIGFRRSGFLPEAFRDIQWGTDMVLKETTAILRGYNLTNHLLPTWRDVDTVEGLRQFLEKKAYLKLSTDNGLS